MKFIPPKEIASKIMTLIDNADQRLVIVTPFLNIYRWEKMKQCLRAASRRKVNITFYMRADCTDNLSHLTELGINPIFIKYLHAKLYLSEKSAIVSSQNMSEFSDNFGIDLGYETETSEELEELDRFIIRYLDNGGQIEPSVESIYSESTGIYVGRQDVDEKEEVRRKFPLTETDIEKLHSAFSNIYFNPDLDVSIEMRNKNEYIYCVALLKFADVMFREGYEVRFISMDDRNKRKVILENIDFSNLHYEYRLANSVKKKDPKPFLFIPIDTDDIEKLISDYVEITRRIFAKSQELEKTFRIM